MRFAHKKYHVHYSRNLKSDEIITRIPEILFHKMPLQQVP